VNLQEVKEIEEILPEDLKILGEQLNNNELFNDSPGDLWLLRKLIESTHKNSPGRNNNRYDSELMKICAYIYITAGKLSYEILCKNLPIPCIKTIQIQLKTKYINYVEGIT
jgi:spore coat polysaccharide biosynthesis predicted glycosyltransferase SpsG